MKFFLFITLIFILGGCGSITANKPIAVTENPGRNLQADKAYCINFSANAIYDYDLGVEMFLQCMEKKGHVRETAENIYNFGPSRVYKKIGTSTLSQDYCAQIHVESEKKLDKLIPAAELCSKDQGPACDIAKHRHLDWAPYAKESAKCLGAGYLEYPGSMIEYKLRLLRAIIEKNKSQTNK